MVSPLAFHRLGSQLIRRGGRRLTMRQFKALFGCSPRVCAALWTRIQRRKLSPCRYFTPSKLLWTLLFLKLYSSEDVLAIMVGCTSKTFRQWVWYGIDVLGELDLVSRCRSSPYSIGSVRANASFLLLLLDRSSGTTGTCEMWGHSAWLPSMGPTS